MTATQRYLEGDCRAGTCEESKKHPKRKLFSISKEKLSTGCRLTSHLINARLPCLFLLTAYRLDTSLSNWLLDMVHVQKKKDAITGLTESMAGVNAGL